VRHVHTREAAKSRQKSWLQARGRPHTWLQARGRQASSHAQRPHTWLQARGRQEGRHTRQKRGFRQEAQERRHAHTRRDHERHFGSTLGCRQEAGKRGGTPGRVAALAQTRGRQERHFGSTLGFRQEAGKRGGTPGRREAHQAEERHTRQKRWLQARGRPHTWLQARGRRDTFTRAETTHSASGKRQASQHRFTKIGVSAREGSDPKSNLSGDSTFCIFSLYTDSQKPESVRRREVIQKAIFPVTPAALDADSQQLRTCCSGCRF
jgi:hypothetical protein